VLLLTTAFARGTRCEDGREGVSPIGDAKEIVTKQARSQSRRRSCENEPTGAAILYVLMHTVYLGKGR